MENSTHKRFGESQRADKPGQSSFKKTKTWRDKGDDNDKDRYRNKQQLRGRQGSENNDHHKRAHSQDEGGNPRKQIYSMGFKHVEGLLNNENLEEVVCILINDKRGFRVLLGSKDNMANNMIVLVVNLLSKICASSFIDSKSHLLQMTLSSVFIDNLTAFISQLALQSEREKRNSNYFWKDPNKFWNSIITLCQSINDIIPNTSCQARLKVLKALKSYMPVIECNHSISISESIKTSIDVLYDIVDKTSIEAEKKQVNKLNEICVELEPPDDFRKINIYPTALEITTSESPFLRPNIIEGPYKSIHHYLDIQFRLLREDFIAPLKTGICKYLQNPKEKLDNIRIYQPVRFLNVEMVNELQCYRIQFNFGRRMKKINYENSKRFLHGSLLCFTSTHFETIIFGKIVGRDIKDLEQGHLIIGFDEMFELPRNLYDTNFLMVESTVYFEPYYHVLYALQRMQEDIFPMERYILKVETESHPPDYLAKGYLHQNEIFGLAYEIENYTFCPLKWGEKIFYGLNNAQHLAFKAALTKEFSIIQGPPGTGKTFLGLKIAHTLINNESVWYHKSPILVICYTNHALDQFLEGLLEVTDKVLRIGNRSKNEKLNKYNILHQKHYSRNFYYHRDLVKACIQDISTINEILKQIELNNSILDFSAFAKIIPHYRRSWFNRVPRDRILGWLFGSTPYQQTYDSVTEVKLDVQDLDNVSNEIDELVDDLFNDIVITPPKPLISTANLHQKINLLQYNWQELQNNRESFKPLTFMMEEEKLTNELTVAQRDLNYLEKQLIRHVNEPANIEPPYADLQRPQQIPLQSRWLLYWHWLDQYKIQLVKKREDLTMRFRKVYRLFNEIRDMENVVVMKKSLVVGMTTTAAARLQSSLQALKSPIVIVEEAAEILEAHIISSLTNHCKHLILIGDHQQLKPSTATYKIETKYRLGISLFERMIMNKIQCHTLNIQHRMRPEISCLIRPSIYQTLEDHESVLNRPPIRGVESCVYFIDHQEPEQLCEDESKKNEHEATFLLNLAKYLVLNGYDPEDIIILVTYLGQMYEIKRRKRDQLLLKDIRVAVLDNYQGEESDIILLSLVRNNDENKIGFLKIENRICVALSRAKNGLYMMGNMKLLCANSDIWKQVKESLEKQNAIGPHLTLRCQIHNDQLTQVSKSDDFMNIPEGGCHLLCNAQISCGHTCKSICHIKDRDHSSYKCREKCSRLLCEDVLHICQKFCYEDCGPCTYQVQHVLNCLHTVTIACSIDPAQYKCTVRVKATLPCGHEVEKKCHLKPEEVACPHPCDVQVEPCGHACARNCHINMDPDHLNYRCQKPCVKSKVGCSLPNDKQHICTKFCYEECEECTIEVQKHRTVCGHVHKVSCNQNVDEIDCKRKCKRTLSCGHKCKNSCNEPCGNCNIPVEKVIPGCQHRIQLLCSQEPDRKMCKNKCPRLLPCGHQCNKQCFQECTTRCKVNVACSISSPCGHLIKNIACSFKDTTVPEIMLKYCTERCNTKLKCNHICSGTCGECSQGRIHVRCKEKCGVPLICNHECLIPCRQACKPCEKKCQYKCEHSKCKRKCGDPCIKCSEPCTRRCEHQRCQKLCGDICNIPPCYEPCQKMLKCMHACIGFCGDPCPVLCRICNFEELTEIFLGNEDKENATYVMLQDCQHIFESEDLEQWLSMDDNKVMRKECPRCRTAITTTQRYNQYVKTCLNDIKSIKLKSQGTFAENNNKRIALLKECMKTQKKAGKLYTGSVHLCEALNTLNARLQLSRMKNSQMRRQPINIMDLESIKSKLAVIDMIIDVYGEQDVEILSSDKSISQISFVLKAIIKDEDRITAQEIEDANLEIQRLSRIVQYEKIKKSEKFMYASTKDDVQLIVQRVSELLDKPNRYSQQTDETLHTELIALNKLVASAVPITEMEKREIVGAIGLSKGHWFKCPNGHFYVIGECGGANQISTCNECGVKIGGTRHQLLPGQSHAPEMDNSQFPAWSEAANLANYRI